MSINNLGSNHRRGKGGERLTGSKSGCKLNKSIREWSDLQIVFNCFESLSSISTCSSISFNIRWSTDSTKLPRDLKYSDLNITGYQNEPKLNTIIIILGANDGYEQRSLPSKLGPDLWEYERLVYMPVHRPKIDLPVKSSQTLQLHPGTPLEQLFD